MARVKRGTTANKRRRNILAQAKGFRWGRKSKERLAKEALRHAWQYSFRDRKAKKRVFRRSWQSRVGAALAEHDTSYSAFAGRLKKSGIALDRKILAQLAKEKPEAFKRVVEKAGS